MSSGSNKPSSQDDARDSWNPSLYEDSHAFVWKLGSSVIELLAPKSGERILDVGCGTGQLTAEIAASAASVVGIDSSAAMIEEARRLYPQLEFHVADARDFKMEPAFDAIFSNAALHWIPEANSVAVCLSLALRPNGRLAIEFGGQGNVHFLTVALQQASQLILGEAVHHPWYFPSIANYARVLEDNGFEVTQAALINRPTPLEGDDGLKNWVRMFGQHWLTRIPSAEHERFLNEVEAIAHPQLHQETGWIADYRRLRVHARRI